MSKWEFLELSELCDLEKGKTGLMKAKEGQYTLVATGKDRRTSDTYQFDTKAVCVPLVSSTGHGHASLKYIHYQEGKFALGTILVAVIPKDDKILNAQFLHLYLSRLKDIVLVPLMTGAANVTLTVTKLKTVKVPLPPIEEQLRIVSLFNHMDNEQAELTSEITYQQTLLKKFRQSILQEAIEGKLTASWREQNVNIESASVLLKKIKIEKEQLIKDKKIKKQKHLSPINEDEIPFKIPNSWEFCFILDLYNVRGGKRVPKGYMLKDEKTKYIYIRVLNMKNSTIVSENLKYIDEEVFHQIEKYTIDKNDLYITIAGTIGRVGKVPSEFHNMNLTENALKMTPICHPDILNDFVLYQMMSKNIQKQFSDKVYGMSMPKLALKRVEDTYLVLPPLEEQKEIVKKIESFFKVCDDLEKQINSSKTNSQTLMQAVLKEAFEK